ncbi:MAG: BtrH N-terminal domain-containing protein, partial [Romboutsia sp.]|nr:BtrH N-terminal domain-containing protein [Romboutsia sp.]
MIIDFEHKQSAHCENGVASNLLNFYGLKISEPMVFGIGSGLFFTYLPFVKVNYAPVVSYRPLSGSIFNNLVKNLNIKLIRKKFSCQKKATDFLLSKISEGVPCGLQVGVYFLPYFPNEYRFHFNAHNLVVYGKKDDSYYISDPVMQSTTTLTEEELLKVRFTKGAFAPKGQIYFPTNIPSNININRAIVIGINKTCSIMLSKAPIIGVSGIRLVGRQITKWPKKYGNKIADHYLCQIVRMQEEIGTGGGGFRFIYAAFIQ